MLVWTPVREQIEERVKYAVKGQENETRLGLMESFWEALRSVPDAL